MLMRPETSALVNAVQSRHVLRKACMTAIQMGGGDYLDGLRQEFDDPALAAPGFSCTT
jgi:hypothetical protein